MDSNNIFDNMRFYLKLIENEISSSSILYKVWVSLIFSMWDSQHHLNISMTNEYHRLLVDDNSYEDDYNCWKNEGYLTHD